MKLDKIKFASLMGFISCRYGLTITQDDMREIDELIDVEVEQQVVYPANHNIEMLMSLMAAGTQKIEAIKTHRAITGYGLKESKDAVERYWKSPLSKEEVAQKLKQYRTFSIRTWNDAEAYEEMAELIVGMQK